MATLDELRLQQLLRPLEGPSGIESLNPLAFQFQNQLYPQSNNTMAKNIMSNFENQLYPQSEEMRDAQILMNRPDGVFTNSVQDPAFSIQNLAGYDYDPYLATKDNFNFNYNLGTRPAFLRTNTPLDMNRFQGVSDMSIIDETTNDEQDQNYIEQVEKSRNPLSGILDLLRNIPTPFNLARRGLESLRGFNQKIRNTDFAKSSTLADYLDARSYGGRDARDRAAQQNMREARAIQRQVDRRGDSTSRVADRNRSSVTKSSAAKSKGVGGGGYTKSDSTRESYRGRY
jgi:hypothetical protein